MPGANPGPALLIAFLSERLKALVPTHHLHPQALRDVAKRVAPAFQLDAEGEIIARSGEDADSALTDRLTSMRSDPQTALYFLSPANDTPATAKSAPLHKLSAREKLSRANGHDPMEYL